MKRLLYLLSACLMTFGFSACNDDDDNLKLQDISVEFAVSEAGMDGETVSLGLKLSRATTESLDVTMEMTSSDVSDADITTTPAMTDGKITVNIPAGQSTGTFTVAKATGKNPEGTAKFQILSLSLTEGYKIGTTKEMTLSFTPIVSTGGTMTLEGKVGDQNYANMVYVDLSNNSQMQIDRKSWNLGFYCGDEFRVVLNSSYATVAAASEKTDFAAVTLEDAQSAPNIAAGSMSEDFKAEWIDDVTGDLSKTAFGEISATDANNKVFFVASADNKTNTDGTENRSLWYKVKVTRSGNGYKVEYGKVEDTTPKTVEITKDPIYSFIGLSLETGEQVLQPAKSKWDIMGLRRLFDHDGIGTGDLVHAGCNHDQPPGRRGNSDRHDGHQVVCRLQTCGRGICGVPDGSEHDRHQLAHPRDAGRGESGCQGRPFLRHQGLCGKLLQAPVPQIRFGRRR